MGTTVAFVTTPEALVAAAPPGLDPATRRRLDRLRPADRDDHLAARALARSLLARHTGEPALLEAPSRDLWEQVCVRCGTGRGHGAPRLRGRPGLAVSWAHAPGWVAAAVGPPPLGIDVERLDAPRPPAPEGPGRPSPWRWFTRVEACVKAGLGDLDAAMSWPLAWDGPRGVAEIGDRRLVVTDWTDPAAEPRAVGAVAVASREEHRSR